MAVVSQRPERLGRDVELPVQVLRCAWLPFRVRMTTALLENSPPTVTGTRPIEREVVRVLHLINGEHYAGAERVQDLLALCLPEQGFEIAFACVKPVKFPSARQSQNAQLFTLPMRSKFDLRPVR